MPDRVPVITVQREAKAPHRSRTLWFNGLVAGLAVAEAKVQLLQPLLPVDAYQVLVFVLVVGNAVLRALTSTGLALGASSAGGDA
jgi:hypothetical protein